MNSRTDCVEDRIRGRGEATMADRCAGNGCGATVLLERHTAVFEFTLEAEGRMRIQERKSTRNVKIIETGILGLKQNAFGWNVSVRRDWHEGCPGFHDEPQRNKNERIHGKSLHEQNFLALGL